MHRLAYEQQKLIPYISGGRQSEMKARVALVLGEGPHPGSDSCPLRVSSQDGRGKGALWGHQSRS